MGTARGPSDAEGDLSGRSRPRQPWPASSRWCQCSHLVSPQDTRPSCGEEPGGVNHKLGCMMAWGAPGSPIPRRPGHGKGRPWESPGARLSPIPPHCQSPFANSRASVQHLGTATIRATRRSGPRFRKMLQGQQHWPRKPQEATWGKVPRISWSESQSRVTLK